MFLKKIEDKKVKSILHIDDDKKNKHLDAFIIELMSKIELQWGFMTSNEFNPVSIALSLLDTSSLGRDYNDFNDIIDNLDKAMDIIVNEYYLSFNNSIHTFSGVIGNISDSQKRVQEMKKKLINCKELLQCKRSDLMHQWMKSIEYKEMLQILETVDELNEAPDRILELIYSKHYLTATKYLLKYIEVANNIDYSSIGALDDIRHDLELIKTSIYNSLIEDFHNHIYLKSKFGIVKNINNNNSNSNSNNNVHEDEYNETNNNKINVNQQEKKNIKKFDISNLKIEKNENMNISKLLYKKIDENYQNEEIIEDPEKNPELDSYNFMKTILECFRLLEKLPEALETIRQRLPLELYSVVEKTINEIDKKNDNSYNASKNSKILFKSNNISDLIGINSQEAKSNLLKDMLNLLYSKLDIIVQAHAFILNTSEKMLKLEGIQTNIYTIRDVWISVQNEIRSLLYDYLTTPETENNTYQNIVLSMNETLKDNKKFKEKNKLIFKFSEDDMDDSINDIYQKNNNYEKILNQEIQKIEENKIAKSLIVIDKYSNSHKVIGHKLLLHPDSRRVLAIFKPTCEFMEKMENIVSITKGSDDISDFRVFLDDFICNIFLPQMEEKVMEYFHLYISGEDSFQSELNELIYPWPLIKSSVACIVITRGLCSTIKDVPIHQEKFIIMIETIIRKYYEKCLSRFKSLLACDNTITDNDQTICSKWIKEEEIIQLLSQNSNLINNSNLDINKNLNEKLANEELNIELGLKQDRSFERGELIFDYKKLEALANLNHSLEWLVSQIYKLINYDKKYNKEAENDEYIEPNIDIQEFTNNMSNESISIQKSNNENPLILNISEEMKEHFNELLGSFQSLSEMCLYALRIEFRCHSMYYLDLTFREGNFNLENEISEPDSYITMLNKDIIKCDEIMKRILRKNKVKFLFNDLGSLMVNILMSNIKFIKSINKNGILKLGRNVRSIQQVLSSISGVYESSMNIAKEYFELLNLEPTEYMKKIEDHGQGPFTYDQLKCHIDLMYSEYLNNEQILQKLEKENQIQLAKSLSNIDINNESFLIEKKNINDTQSKYNDSIEKLKMICTDSPKN